MVCTECLLIFGTYSVGFHSWFLHFLMNLETIKASSPFAFISLSSVPYQKDSINRMNDGQANH